MNSLRVDFDVDIYLTGSNSRLLSSELATYLAGRYIEIPVYTLSFAEYLLFRQEYAPDKIEGNYAEFEHFLRKGGFPAIHTGNYSDLFLLRALPTILKVRIVR